MAVSEAQQRSSAPVFTAGRGEWNRLPRGSAGWPMTGQIFGHDGLHILSRLSVRRTPPPPNGISPATHSLSPSRMCVTAHTFCT